MLARALRIAQLVELAACLAAGAWLHAARGWGPLAVGLGVVAWFAGARLVLVSLSSLLGWIFRTPRAPRERIGVARGLLLVATEWRALLVANLLDLPWERLALRPDPPAAPTDRVPVVLVHGYYANRGYLRPLVRRLEARGVGPIFVPSASYVLAPIEAFADELHERLERIAAGTGQPRVVLVCHSMGGLIARACIARHGAGRIARLVTLGSPHHGSVLAHLGLGENARQMLPGSDFLVGLARAESALPGPETVSIYSTHDNMVMPQASSRLEGARNVAIPGLGHIAMLSSPRLLEALLAALEGIGAEPAS
ncbi:MAG TPA: alpha/beta fold hydrolase [Usitatibacter sp.]|nr:alpha/beta fold hydrolase [Usitatibacter sp.]